MNNKDCIPNRNKELKDVFGAYLLEGSEFEGFYDMPVIDVKLNINPKVPVCYSQLNSSDYGEGSFAHFYEFDYKFDGRDGVWNSLIQNTNFKRGFNINKLNNVSFVISPDFSLYMDMPRVMQIWNIYRSRTVCYRFNKLGYLCLPNVRWTDENSYSYSFDGLCKGCAVAVGTLGCSKSNYDKDLFIKGFEEMIKRVEPSHIIIYGSLTLEIKKLLDYYHQSYSFFPSDTSNYYGGKQ